MLGWPFGAKGYLRLSYGSLPPNDSIDAISKLKNGLLFLRELAASR